MVIIIITLYPAYLTYLHYLSISWDCNKIFTNVKASRRTGCYESLPEWTDLVRMLGSGFWVKNDLNNQAQAEDVLWVQKEPCGPGSEIPMELKAWVMLEARQEGDSHAEELVTW